MLSHLQTYRAAADLDAQMMDLERALSVLRAQRAVVQERLDSYKYPVLTVPNEIVSGIFLHFTPPYPPLTGTLSPINLTHICRKWREIALATPMLWKAVGFFPADTRRVDPWLNRSYSCPISIDIKRSRVINSEFEVAAALTAALSRHRARWEHVKLDLALITHLPSFDGPMPLLRYLDIAIAYPASDVVVFGDAPMLRSAILNDVALKIVLPWVQLTSLVLHTMYPLECVPILRQTSKLVHCKLALVYGASIPWEDVSVTLLHLESLFLLGDSINDRYLGTFTVPALREFQIMEASMRHPINALTTFISQSGCKLQEMAISGRRYVSRSTYRSAFPSVIFSFDGDYFGEGPDETVSANVDVE